MNKRVRFSFSGVVQGVGFRPFVHRIATKHALGGFVQNRPDGVIAEVEGVEAAIERFHLELLDSLPPNANIDHYQHQEIELTGENIFQIIPSTAEGTRVISIPPDIATCPECLNELFNPADKRFKYPFTNCTNCGPRFTLALSAVLKSGLLMPRAIPCPFPSLLLLPPNYLKADISLRLKV